MDGRSADELLRAIRDIIQEDVGNRGLRTVPGDNLITASGDDFANACRCLAEATDPAVGIVTGFFIPDAAAGETDGPLGAVFLARALAPLGMRVAILTDPFCVSAVSAGLALAGLRKTVPVVSLPLPSEFDEVTPEAYWQEVLARAGRLTHLIAIERVGPSHTPASLRDQPGSTAEDVRQFEQDVPADTHDCCQTMRGKDISEKMCPAHWLFEVDHGLVTIGIGDGGNEIGMGQIPWRVIQRNIPRGGQVACRIATDHLIVCGVSNWGGYALASGVRLLKGQPPDADLLDIEKERSLLEMMVQKGPLVDGVSGQETATVDGLSFERYVQPLQRIGALFGLASPAAEPPAAGGLAFASNIGSTPEQPANAKPPAAEAAEVRRRAREGELTGVTCGLALGFVQANLVVVPRSLAFDFLLFCQRNPKPCPLLDVTEVGSFEPTGVAAGADLRTDLPRYRIYRNGELIDEPADLKTWWSEESVAFLIGCSFTFENALLQAGLPLRHLEMGCNVPMYRTNITCRPAGVFRGPMVVSMRPMTPAQAIRATEICARFGRAHGAPIHLGEPGAIGIRDLDRPDFGDAVELRPGEVPVFWACGVTPQAVAMEVRAPLLMTHKPGCMFVTDLRDHELME